LYIARPAKSTAHPFTVDHSIFLYITSLFPHTYCVVGDVGIGLNIKLQARGWYKRLDVSASMVENDSFPIICLSVTQSRVSSGLTVYEHCMIWLALNSSAALYMHSKA